MPETGVESFSAKVEATAYENDVQRLVHAELPQAATIVNLGAGVGSYEPVDWRLSMCLLAQTPSLP
jgi:hypothetical protein